MSTEKKAQSLFNSFLSRKFFIASQKTQPVHYTLLDIRSFIEQHTAKAENTEQHIANTRNMEQHTAKAENTEQHIANTRNMEQHRAKTGNME
jgi:hypothetical protein